MRIQFLVVVVLCMKPGDPSAQPDDWDDPKSPTELGMTLNSSQPCGPSIEELVLRGVLAIQPGTRMKPERARILAQAALAAAAQTGEAWDEILGIARNESDFIVDAVSSDGLDCGIMQTRVLYSNQTCDDLRKDVRLGFLEGAREMAKFRAACVQRGTDSTRCRLNGYNSGFTKRVCAPNDHKCRAKAQFAGRYWLRVKCFADAARDGVRVGDECRKAVEEPRLASR